MGTITKVRVHAVTKVVLRAPGGSGSDDYITGWLQLDVLVRSSANCNVGRG